MIDSESKAISIENRAVGAFASKLIPHAAFIKTQCHLVALWAFVFFISQNKLSSDFILHVTAGNYFSYIAV